MLGVILILFSVFIYLFIVWWFVFEDEEADNAEEKK